MRYITRSIARNVIMGLLALFPFVPAQALEENLEVVLPTRPTTLKARIEERIADALIQQSDGEDFSVSVLNNEAEMMGILHQGDIEIIDAALMEVGDKGRYLTASLRYMLPDGKENNMEVRARYEELMEVPVAAVRLRRGDVIGEKDIMWQKIQSSRIKQGTIHNEADIIGKSPTRTLIPGRPIQGRMLSEPIVVHHQDKVWMVYQTPMVKIMATGVAMEDGSKNDLIAVKNVNSGAVVHAIVTDGRYVRIPSVEGTLAYEVAENAKNN